MLNLLIRLVIPHLMYPYHHTVPLILDPLMYPLFLLSVENRWIQQQYQDQYSPLVALQVVHMLVLLDIRLRWLPHLHPPIPSPTGPQISPSGPPTPTGSPTPPPAPPVGVSTGPMPFLWGIDWREHRINPTKLEDSVVANTYAIPPWIFNCPKVGSTVNHGVWFKTFVCNLNTYMRAIATQRLGTETMSLKSFLYGSPKLKKLATCYSLLHGL